MRAPTRTVIVLLTSLACFGVACERTSSPSSPGAAAASLVSPFTDDAAALVEFTGDVRSVTAPAGTLAYLEDKGGGVVHVLIVRETPGAIQFTLGLANRSRLPSARVLEVSDGGDVPRVDVSAYRVQF